MNRHIVAINGLMVSLAMAKNTDARDAIERDIHGFALAAAEAILHECFEDLCKRGGDWFRLAYQAYHTRRGEYSRHPLERISDAIMANDGTLEGVLWASAIWHRAYHAALSGREAVTL